MAMDKSKLLASCSHDQGPEKSKNVNLVIDCRLMENCPETINASARC